MKFICTQQNFCQGLSIAEKVIGKNFALPILQNILINCEKNTGRIKLSSTDLEMGIEVIIPSKIEEEGSVAIPAKLISGFVRNLPDEKIDFSGKSNKILIQCANYKSTIKGQDSKEFPLIPQDKNADAVTLKIEDFISGISRVINSVSLLDIKPEISGVFVQFREEDTCFAATDSFRLAEKSIKNSKKNTFIDKTIIPRRACDVIMRVFGDAKDSIGIEINENQITIKNSPQDPTSPKIRFVSKIIEGDYPNYEQIIPSNFTTTIKAPKDELIRHIKTAGLFSNKIHEVVLQSNAKKQQLEIMSEDAEHGDHYSVLPCKIQGNDEKVVLNYEYLLDGMQGLLSPTVSLKMNQANTPIMVSSPEDEGFRYLLMPIKT
ncbi:MAG: DNA polymerase III subunit beta [Candidatus Spechtbacterales bacterium]